MCSIGLRKVVSRRVTITVMCLLLPHNARVCPTHSYQCHVLFVLQCTTNNTARAAIFVSIWLAGWHREQCDQSRRISRIDCRFARRHLEKRWGP